MTWTGQGSALWSRIAGHRRERQRRDAATSALYGAIVQEARAPAYYSELGVPDSAEGRFEMLALHMALVMGRLRALGPAGSWLAHSLVDLLVADMDRNLREMGVGDLSVGKHVKAMAASFLARAKSLDAALFPQGGGPADRAALRAMLREKIYDPAVPPTGPQLSALADALVAKNSALAKIAPERLLAGDIGEYGPSRESN